MFSYEYSQPDDYHFCQDSILAPKLIAHDLLAADAAPRRALDVCAGCGVMAFELLHALGADSSIAHFDFLEIQTDFRPHFDRNLEITGSTTLKTEWIHANYSVLLDSPSVYDLIIANPPYFARNEGTASPNELNTRARFFIDSDLTTLLRGIQQALRPKGRAYVLMKSGKEHGRDAFTSARVLLYDCRVERLADVRGTDLVRMIKD